MPTCAICGPTNQSFYSYTDHIHAIHDTITICATCLFQHIAYHWPDSMILHSCANQLGLSISQAESQFPPRSITQRLAEIPFQINPYLLITKGASK